MKTGLVFSGGGARGAFEVGVWKALREFGLDASIQVVSGTSVGALNAVLFAQGNLDVAERFWMNITPEMVLGVKQDQIQSIIGYLLTNYQITLPLTVLNWLGSFRLMGILRQEPLERLIREHLDHRAIQKGMPCYATATELPGFKTTHFRLNDFDRETMVQILLASAAIPVLWKSVKIQDRTYVDGGFSRELLSPGNIEDTSNVPVLPTVHEDCQRVFVVFLGRSETISHDRFPGCEMIHIVPQDSMGGLLSGTLNFDGTLARRNLEMGYQSAVAIFRPAARVAALDALDRNLTAKTLRLQAENRELLDRMNPGDDGEPKGFFPCN